MEPSIAVTLVSILLLSSVQAQNTHRITDKERWEVENALNHTLAFIEVIQPGSHDFDIVLDVFNRTLGPWVHGFKAFSNIIILFEAWEEDIAYDLRERYHKVNIDLEEARMAMIPAMDTIDWEQLYIDFHSIVEEVQLLEGKLAEILYSTVRDHGVAEYVRFYEKWYKDAGRRLFESIVEHDGFYKFNVLDAALEFNPTDRRLVNNFMQGLMVLAMRAAAIELAYERCWEHDRGLDKIWVERLWKIQVIMSKKDTYLKDTAWLVFKDEAEKLAEDNAGLSHDNWAEVVFQYFTEKYFWRGWYVQSFYGSTTAAIGYTSDNGHMGAMYGRVFLVMSESLGIDFDVDATLALIKDQHCELPDIQCFDNGPQSMFDLLPVNGTVKVVMEIDDYDNTGLRAHPERVATGTATLHGTAKSQTYRVIYAG